MEEYNWMRLLDAVKSNDTAAVKGFIEDDKISISSTIDTMGNTVAHEAARTGNVEMVKYLGSKEPLVLTTKNASNQTVLHLAVVKGSLDIIKYLVDEMDIDIFHENNLRLGNNAVHVAAREGHTEILKYFIEEKHVDVNVQNENGEPPVFLAASKRKLHVIKLLLEQYNANVKMLDFHNRNILFPASLTGDVTIPTYLLDEKKIDLEINWRDELGRSVLHWSSFASKLDISQYFIEQKHADVNMLDLKKQTPLHIAAQGSHIKLIQFLLEAGANLTLEDAEGKTPAQCAKKKKVVEFFDGLTKKRELRSTPESTVSGSRSTVQQPVPYEWTRWIAQDILSLHGYLSDYRSSLQQVASINGPEGILVLAIISFRYNKRSSYQIPLSLTESVHNRIVDPIATDIIESVI